MRNVFFASLLLIVFSSCITSRSIERRSNLMSYLYPDQNAVQTPNPGGARLQLPLRIGIAFVPPDRADNRFAGDFRSTFPAETETKLLDIVKKNFQGREWVSEIVVIPSTYLVARGGFSNLEQVARLMNVDVVALASIDQMQVSNPRRASFLYMSIIGAYLLPLDHNETRTMIDVAAFHVPSHTFLLRAPGVNSISGNSSAVDVDAKLDERSARGFELAMSDLSKNLSTAVDQFKANVASGQLANVDIITKKWEVDARWWSVRLARRGDVAGRAHTAFDEKAMIDLWTCHLLHWGWQHALLNFVAALPPLVAMPRGRRWLFAPFLVIAAPFITLAIRAGFTGEYRGASGLVVAMWVFAGLFLRDRLLLSFIAAKLAVEVFGSLPSHDAYMTVSIAHFAGAVAGLLGAAVSTTAALQMDRGITSSSRDPRASSLPLPAAQE